MDVATGTGAAPEVEEHVRGCEACQRNVRELRATMGLLGEWPEIEPTPYFDVRLRARLRDEAPAPAWWAWLRKPGLAAVFVLLIAAGVGLFQRSQPVPDENVARVQQAGAHSVKMIGTAVSDLQMLDRNEDLYANFDLLDDVPSPDDSNARAQ